MALVRSAVSISLARHSCQGARPPLIRCARTLCRNTSRRHARRRRDSGDRRTILAMFREFLMLRFETPKLRSLTLGAVASNATYPGGRSVLSKTDKKCWIPSRDQRQER
jgi:hypothetical protein